MHAGVAVESPGSGPGTLWARAHSYGLPLPTILPITLSNAGSLEESSHSVTQVPGGSPCFTNHEIEAQRGKVACPGPVQSSGLTGTTAFPHGESESGPPPAPLPSHRFAAVYQTGLGVGCQVSLPCRCHSPHSAG